MSEPVWDVQLKGRLGELEVDLAFQTDATRLVVVGPNGAGKSSLLRAIVGARLGLTGHVRVAGQTWQDGARHTPPEDRGVGYVPQGCRLFAHLSVRDNVAFGCAPGAAGRARADSVLREMGAAHLAGRPTHDLSGGEQQRIALARALAPDPRAVLLDEPLAALDPVSRVAMRALLANQLTDRVALTVTHDERDVAALGDWLVVVENGRVVQQGAVDSVRAAPKTGFGAAFFAT